MEDDRTSPSTKEEMESKSPLTGIFLSAATSNFTNIKWSLNYKRTKENYLYFEQIMQ